jgi:valyl-tRNA synthetase
VSASVKPLASAEGLRTCEPVIRRLANLESLSWGGEVVDGATVAVDPAFQVAVELGAANREAERDRLRKELEEMERRLENVGRRLANPQFVRNAKPEIVEGARAEERELQVLRDTIRARLRDLEK